MRERHRARLHYGQDPRVSIHAPVRERLASTTSPARYFSFNSRSREGATGIMACNHPNFIVSIHAPVRERRFKLCCFGDFDTVSIHAPVRERPANVHRHK